MSKSECGGKPSLIGVTVADGTEDVGVLDLLPVLLGVAATESDSEPSSLLHKETCISNIHEGRAVGLSPNLKHIQER